MERVTLIHKSRVAEKIEQLECAEKIANANLRSAAVASAKKQIRNVAIMTNAGRPTIKNVTPQEVDVYRKCLRDVGGNTFVFDDNSLNTADAEIAKQKGVEK